MSLNLRDTENIKLIRDTFKFVKTGVTVKYGSKKKIYISEHIIITVIMHILNWYLQLFMGY